MEVGIIGGGALGLSAAYELTRRGHKPVVYERAPFLGGQASTFDVGGGRLERGYHHLFRSDTSIVELIEELGLGDKMAWIESSVGFYSQGAVHPFTTPLDLLRFKPLTLFQRLRLGLVTFYLQRKKYWPREYEQVTARDWLRRRIGQRALDVVWGPLLRGKFGDHADEVSMAWLWGKIYLRTTSRDKGLRGRERLGYPMGSFAEIFEALERAIPAGGGELHYPATVKRVVVEDGRATGLVVERDGKEETRRFDAVLATSPSSVVPALVPELPDDYKALLTKVRYEAAILIVMQLDRPLTPYYWINIADSSIPFVGMIEHTNFVDKSLYGGRHLVYLSNYVAREDKFYNMPPDELWAHYVPAIKRIVPDFDESSVIEWSYHRENAAQPIIGVDYSKQIPSLKTPIEDLWLANTTQIYPEDRGTNYSVRLGRLMARILTGEAPNKMWWE